MNSDMQAQHNLLTWMLAGFYLGQLLEKTGRRFEALAHYEEFIKHFESSASSLKTRAATDCGRASRPGSNASFRTRQAGFQR